MADEINLGELVKGSVSIISDKLESLDDVQLAKLGELEQAGQKRSTLMDAINREMSERDARDDASDSGNTPPPATDAGADDGKLTREQVDAMLAERDETHKADVQAIHDSYAAKIAELSEARASGPVGADRGADLMRSDDAFYIPIEGVHIAFIDDAGAAIGALPALAMAASSFKRSGSRLTLNKEIKLPATLAATQIAGAVLLDESDDDVADAIGKAMLVQPFSVGGGRETCLPAGTLTFTR